MLVPQTWPRTFQEPAHASVHSFKTMKLIVSPYFIVFFSPSVYPTTQPSSQPSTQPISKPSSQPSLQPTSQPSEQPSEQPTTPPSFQPSRQPASRPSSQPSLQPTGQPSSQPSSRPTQAQSTTFSYTGVVQAYNVPAGVTTVTVTAAGAQGRYSGQATTPRNGGSLGGLIVAMVAVAPRTTLCVYVGGAGRTGLFTNTGGFNGGGNASYWIGANPPLGGGGGGGASDVRTVEGSLTSRLVVAGGGGGESDYCNYTHPFKT